MKNLHQKHINITQQVKNTIKEYQVVFPAQYGQLYSEIAQMHHVELNPEELVYAEMLDEKMVRHVISLCEYGDRAIDAMEANNALKLKEVIEETKKLHTEMQHLQQIVYEDSLTKTYNRKWFEDTYLNASKDKFSKSGTLVVADLNYFKTINDTYGHLVGDKVLKHIAKKFQDLAEEVIRYGGDEFVLLFSADYSEKQIDEKLSRLLHYYTKRIFKSDGQEFKIGFSYGMASFEKETWYEEVIKIADNAMYRHKRKSQ